MQKTTQQKQVCQNCRTKSISLFADGFLDSTCAVLEKKEELIFKKGEKIVNENDPFEGFYCIQSGIVKIYRPLKGKSEFILWFAKPGESIGIDSFFNNEGFQYSASAASTVKVCFISTPKINALMKNGATTYLRLMEYFCKRIDFIEKRITSIAQKKTKSHLAELLVSLGENNLLPEEEINVDYSIKDLANIIGTTQNYLYKISSELIKDKIISVDNKKFTILDHEKLNILARGAK